jgi:hypothetical protein
MNRREERQMQDYLDGRLEEEGRRSFEAKMASDPELASRVAFHRKAKELLGERLPALPPGFQARARTRFVEAHAVRPRGAPVFLLKAAGLALAAGLVVVVLLGRKSPDSRPFLPESGPVEEKHDVSDEAARPEPSVPPEEKEVVADAPRVPASRKAASGPSVAAEAPARATAALRLSKSSEPQDSLEQASESESATRCEELPEGVRLTPQSSTVITEPSQEPWKELTAGAATTALRRLGADFRTERVVLIGAPCGCRGLRVLLDPEKVRILVPPEAAGPSDGCAVAIPAGSSPVEIGKAADGPR